MVTAPLPSILAGRASNDTVCGCSRRSSAASSMVTIRSSAGIKEDSTFNVVVLPEPVPPLTMILSRALMQARRTMAISSDRVPKEMRFSTDSGVCENFRMVMHGPFSANGGIMMLTRDPSLRRASTRGDASSMCRPRGVTILSTTVIRCAVSWNWASVFCSLPIRST